MRRLLCLLFASAVLLAVSPNSMAQALLIDAPQAQQSSTGSSVPAASPTVEPTWRSKYGKNHILWIFPNYRSDEESDHIEALRPGQKFKIALDDSFDASAFLVAAGFAGFSMAERSYPSFGVGAQGYAKYFGGAFADQAIGNFMTEAILPAALHQDPRYFVKGKGGFFKRAGYALSREVVTRSDSGTSQFNTSEIVGNGLAAGISNIYYPDRSISNTTSKWGEQIGLDAFFNILKEFWPDVRQGLWHK